MGIIQIDGNGIPQDNWEKYTENTLNYRGSQLHTEQAIQFIQNQPPEYYQNLLDIGSGTGRSTLDFLEQTKLSAVTAVDFDQKALSRLEQRVKETLPNREIAVTTLAGDITQTDLGGQKFDVVNGTDVFSYVGDGNPESFAEGMRQILSLVREGGGIFSGNFFGEQTQWTEKGKGHSHIAISVDTLTSLLTQNGFQILSLEENINPNPEYSDYIVTMHKIFVVATKP